MKAELQTAPVGDSSGTDLSLQLPGTCRFRVPELWRAVDGARFETRRKKNGRRHPTLGEDSAAALVWNLETTRLLQPINHGILNIVQYVYIYIGVE